jgi:hypothetical protein
MDSLMFLLGYGFILRLFLYYKDDNESFGGFYGIGPNIFTILGVSAIWIAVFCISLIPFSFIITIPITILSYYLAISFMFFVWNHSDMDYDEIVELTVMEKVNFIIGLPLVKLFG